MADIMESYKMSYFDVHCPFCNFHQLLQILVTVQRMWVLKMHEVSVNMHV